MDATLIPPASAARRARESPGRSRALVEALRSPACYPHPAADVALVETHISFVLLAGEHAYKVKKPVELGFVHFGTLAARRAACQEEVRLNRRTAPGLYLGVVPIAGPERAPVVGGAGPAIEYAVHMRRFPQEALLDHLARAGALGAAHVDALARALADFHARERRGAPPGDCGTPERALADALDNFRDIEALEGGDARLVDSLERLRDWTCAEHRALAPFIAERRSDGFVRECHGDLHLANVALLDGRPVPFDCIEFDPRLRWIDVMSEVAFTAMDLERHGLAALAARFVDAYLSETGDYPGLRVRRFYSAYRAMVRAKIACIRAHQLPPPERPRAAAELAADLALAHRLAHRPRPALVVMHGLSGSGKTAVSQRILEAAGAVRLRSDVERKRLHGLRAGERSGSAPGLGIYTARENELTYGRLAELASWSLAAGYPTIVDAAFLRRSERDAFRALASAAGASFAIASCVAPEPLLRERIAARAAAGADASEAGLAVLDLQRARIEPLARDEAAHAVVFETAHPGGTAAACRALLARLRPVRHVRH